MPKARMIRTGVFKPYRPSSAARSDNDLPNYLALFPVSCDDYLGMSPIKGHFLS